MLDLYGNVSERYEAPMLAGWPRLLEVRTLAFKLSSLGSNLGRAINCHLVVLQTEWFVNVCAVLQIDVKLGVPSAGIS